MVLFIDTLDLPVLQQFKKNRYSFWCILMLFIESPNLPVLQQFLKIDTDFGPF
jgi:hypothetical protein